MFLVQRQGGPLISTRGHNTFSQDNVLDTKLQHRCWCVSL